MALDVALVQARTRVVGLQRSQRLQKDLKLLGSMRHWYNWEPDTFYAVCWATKVLDVAAALFSVRPT